MHLSFLAAQDQHAQLYGSLIQVQKMRLRGAWCDTQHARAYKDLAASVHVQVWSKNEPSIFGAWCQAVCREGPTSFQRAFPDRSCVLVATCVRQRCTLSTGGVLVLTMDTTMYLQSARIALQQELRHGTAHRGGGRRDTGGGHDARVAYAGKTGGMRDTQLQSARGRTLQHAHDGAMSPLLGDDTCLCDE